MHADTLPDGRSFNLCKALNHIRRNMTMFHKEAIEPDLTERIHINEQSCYINRNIAYYLQLFFLLFLP